jgi:transcriptional regulator with XRE-family HTH domain
MKTISRWENFLREPRASDIKKLCEVLGVTEAELLNGPKEESFTVELNYVKSLEGVKEQMNMNGISLTVADDGFVGVSGGKNFKSRDDIEAVIEDIRYKLNIGFDTRERMAGDKKLEG